MQKEKSSSGPIRRQTGFISSVSVCASNGECLPFQAVPRDALWDWRVGLILSSLPPALVRRLYSH